MFSQLLSKVKREIAPSTPGGFPNFGRLSSKVVRKLATSTLSAARVAMSSKQEREIISAAAEEAIDRSPSHSAAASYSAAGEDRLVLAWLQIEYRIPTESIRYCDIGANHPRDLNNTYLFYLRGASGVLVEPDPAQVELLKEVRPRDTVLSKGIAFDDRRKATLHRLTSNVFNTFSSRQSDHVVSSSQAWHASQLQAVVDTLEVDLVPANDVLAEHFPEGLHFLSIDAEGVDFDILKSIDIARFRPCMICVEACRALADFNDLLAPFGYSLFARTPDNLIFGLPFK